MNPLVSGGEGAAYYAAGADVPAAGVGTYEGTPGSGYDGAAPKDRPEIQLAVLLVIAFGVLVLLRKGGFRSLVAV